jgi:hypothetical protein
MGARDRVEIGLSNRVVVPTRQAKQPSRIGSLESILGLLESLKIQALDCMRTVEQDNQT